MKNAFKLILIALFLSCYSNSKGQRYLGADVQIYPAGIMPGLYAGKLLGEKDFIGTRVGLNIANRRDWGKHQEEKGMGYGISLEYLRFLWQNARGLYFGPRVDLWKMTINWKQNIGKQNQTEGKSDIVIFQPTVKIGYQFNFKNTYLGMRIGISQGMEFNIKTKGEPVGEGWISLADISLLYHLY